MERRKTWTEARGEAMTDHEPYPFCCPEHYPLRSMTGPKPTGAIISDHLLTEYERAEVAKAVRYLQDKHISFEGIKMFEEVAMSNTEIVRTIKIDDKNIEVHIHLTEDEIRRLLLPLVVQAFADEMRRNMGAPRWIQSGSTVPTELK